jgi:opacity protein-like surface antigen
VEGWGMGLVGGVFCLDDVSKNFATPLGSLNANISFDKGWGVVVPVNYQFADGLSLGFSAGYEKAHFNEFSATLGGITGSADLDGKLSLVPLMANVGYYVPLTDSLTWNFGGGAGGVRIETLMVGDPVSDVTWNLGFQAFTGLNLAVSPQAVLNLGYRYTLAKDTVADLSGHLVEAGVTFRF